MTSIRRDASLSDDGVGIESADMTPYCRLLGRDPAPADLVGGKGASLSRLVERGLRVPPGIVITVEAFTATIEHLRLGPALATVSACLARGEVAAAGAQVEDGLRRGVIPSRVFAPICEAVETTGLWRDNASGVIVRSSATVEDSHSFSFAGIFESIVAPSPASLERTILQVWSSALSQRALVYLTESGVATAPSMAIVLQRFIEASRSGVMFTRFVGPAKRPQILIEHVEGGCEKLVKGEVTPARLWLDRDEGTDSDGADALGATHVRELRRLATEVDDLFGGPQDVEWLIHDDTVHVVQSRPITTPASPLGATACVDANAAEPILTGVAASPGAGGGPVHRAFNIERALELRSGSVLVTPMTNPDMVVAMRRSSAIVTDVGGVICHAAIVSRELGLPCVVGTGCASDALTDDQPVTVDGFLGAVYDGLLPLEPRRDGNDPLAWADLWATWIDVARGRHDLTPLVPTIDALADSPPGTTQVALLVDLDLRCGPNGLWNDVEALPAGQRAAVLDDYAQRLEREAERNGLRRLWLVTLDRTWEELLVDATGRLDAPALMVLTSDPTAPPLVLDPGMAWPDGPAVVPLVTAVKVRHEGAVACGSVITSMREAVDAALGTERFFGHTPTVRRATMPDVASRSEWWALLPEYGRFHREHATERTAGDFDWLDVRPELVISALLKSLVQPGFEMVPRILGFRDMAPLHIKWIRCRYHFQADAFAKVWTAIVRSTWDEDFMADMFRRVRASYDALAEVLALFPESDDELTELTSQGLVALVTAWWPRWVEFFALCWFIQAQGDDILYPFIEETVGANLAQLGPPPAGRAWPTAVDLVAPLTPVMSAQYMADLAGLRTALLDADLGDADGAVRSIAAGQHPDLATRIGDHIRLWGWMRDRDLLFEPWDTPARVIEIALSTDAHCEVSYESNRRAHMRALGFHVGLAQSSGRAGGLAHATRFLHDLNVERENHHMLWLKYSYSLRRVFAEMERRLRVDSDLDPGDVFFLQCPELLRAVSTLPEALPDALIARVRNRRAGYLYEARLAPDDAAPDPEDDYY